MNGCRRDVGARAVLAFLIAAGAATSGAGAQTAPQASKAPTQLDAPGGGAPTIAVSKKPATAVGHLPIIDIVPVFTQPLFVTNGLSSGRTSNVLKNNGTGYDPLDIGGTITYPLTPTVSASLDRFVGGTLDVPNAPVTLPPTRTGTEAYHYNAFTRDVVVNYRLDERLHRLQVEEGLNFRHRVVGGSSSSSDPASINSTEGHFGYVGLTYATAGIPWLHDSFFTFSMNADTQAVDHHVGCGSACPPRKTAIDENPLANRLWETDQAVGVTVPVDRRHGISFSAQDRWRATTFFENLPAPLRFTTSQTYVLTKRFNRTFALMLRAKD